MRSSNPVLGRAFGNKRGYAAFEPRSTDALEEMYSSPSASPLQRMMSLLGLVFFSPFSLL